MGWGRIAASLFFMHNPGMMLAVRNLGMRLLGEVGRKEKATLELWLLKFLSHPFLSLFIFFHLLMVEMGEE